MPPRKKENPKLEAALQYANEGLSVIPLRPDDSLDSDAGKKPLLSSWKEYQSKRLSNSDLAGFWHETPEANVGIVTGEISGLSVIDIDGHVGIESLRKAGIDLPQTKTVKTPKGLHYYYQFTTRLKQTAGILDHVDIRSEGGYVVAPPSYVNGTEYKLARNMPPVYWDTIPEQLSGREASPNNGVVPHALVGGTAPWVTNALENGEPEGTRDDRAAQLAGYFHARGVGADIIFATLKVFADRCTPPYPHKELKRAVESVTTRYQQTKVRSHQGVKIKDPLVNISETGEVKVMWADDGVTMTFDRPVKLRTSITTKLTVESVELGYLLGPLRYDTLSLSKTEVLVRALNKREERPWLEMLSAASRLVTFSVDTTANFVSMRDYKIVRDDAWAVEPLTPAKKPAVIYADGGSGKSTLAIAVAMSVASGIEIVPGVRPAVTGNVMYLDWEAVEEDMGDIMNRIARGLGPQYDGTYYNHNDFDVTYVECQDNLANMAEEIQSRAEEDGTVFIVVDSAVPAASDDVNDVEAPRAMFRALRQIGRPSLLLAHVSKEDAQKPFGSAFWWNLARSVWKVSHEQLPDSDYLDIGLEHRKANNFKLQAPFGVRVSYDEKQNAITFLKTSVMGLSQVAENLPVSYRVSSLLSDGVQRNVSEIHEELNDGAIKPVSFSAVDKALKRGKEFIRHTDPSGKHPTWSSR